MQKGREDIRIEVIAYSGYRANERPLYFVLEQNKLEVKKVLDRWLEQDHDYFKVLAGDGCVYVLKWHRAFDVWFVEKKKGRA